AEILEHVSHGEKGAVAGANLEALFAGEREGPIGLRNRSADRKAGWRQRRVVAFRETQRSPRNSRLDSARRRPHGASVVSPWQERLRPATTNPAEGQRPARVLTSRLKSWLFGD